MPLTPGSPFPDATLPALDAPQQPLSTAWAAGDALLLVGHSDCRTTRLALPCVERIHRRRAHGTTVLALLQDTPEAARALCDELGLTLPVRLESDPYTLAAALHVAVVPTLFAVDREGRVASVAEAFDKQAFEELAARFGAAPLFEPDDTRPARRPG